MHKNVLNAELLRHSKYRKEIFCRRVNFAVAYEADQVDVGAFLNRLRKRVSQHVVLAERSRSDRIFDAGDLGSCHAACPECEVADLGVAALARRLADALT